MRKVTKLKIIPIRDRSIIIDILNKINFRNCLNLN
jgi:hypothetical protein